ncbi:hypothetical protein ACEWY4_007625 [Coilia grayii]|uniref:Uncharacterized protein n=1 Tax=Coilia grayii TaxID=363190 RepID=A0ABD1KHR9_9TELE
MSVMTCEESLEKLKPMADGLVERYRRAGEPAPELMYVDRGCCRQLGVSSVEQMFGEWTNAGMLVRLDIFHWIHRFNRANRTDHHPKYQVFKSALSAAVFAYNKDDVARLLRAIRAGHPTRYEGLTDSELIETRVTKYELTHYVRRVTVGAQETYARVQRAIDILKGPAGMDENQIHLFKSDADIDATWANQQKHLECIQDPPGRNMYTVVKHVNRNGVQLPYYTTVGGSTSLEGFHAFLSRMIPGPHCAAVPFQVYLLAGIARWNSDREAESVRGRQGRRHMVYTSPLVDRLNQRCQELFGEVEEENFRRPVPAGDERIGLEYLFAQSTTEQFNASTHYAHTREVLQASDDEDEEEEREEGAAAPAAEGDSDESDEDVGYDSAGESDRHLIPLRRNIRLTDQEVAAELDLAVEDVCGQHRLPGYEHVEELSRVLVDISLEEGRLALSERTRQRVIAAWNKLELHDRSIQHFDSLYSSRWGNALFGRTCGDPAEAALVQRLKFTKRHAAAHLVDSRKNRLMYCVVKQLWLHPECQVKARGSPLKAFNTSAYQRMQQRVTVDDPVLSKLGIPILKINSRSISDFLRRQEALSATNITDPALGVLRRHQSIASTSQAPAPELPDQLPHTARPQVQYEITPSLAGTRALKTRDTQRRVRKPYAILPKPPLPPAPQQSSSAPAPLLPPPTQPPPALLQASASAAASATQQPSAMPALPPLPSLLPAAAPRPLPSLLPAAASGPQAPLTPQSSQPVCPARSTIYKRRRSELSGGNVKEPKVYLCGLCGQPTQGHKKYKKKDLL